MAGRKKSDYPTKVKKISTPISDLDMNRLKKVSEKHNLIYLDVIKKGIECIIEGNFDTDYSISGVKNKQLCIRATEEELNYIRSIVKEKKIKYLDVVMIGLKYYENKK